VTRLRATATRRLADRLSLVFVGDNLLDVQRGEPDNLTVLPGRTLSTGLRVGF
jgi:iron complex outermembrane receptor protein